MKQTVAVAGCGSRGWHIYIHYMKQMQEKAEIVAIADTDVTKVEKIKEELKLNDSQCYSSAEELLEQPKLADLLCIATLDQDHVRQAIRALELGYDLLLEKPISGEKEECQKILEVATRLNRRVVVCHVLRYSPFYRKLKELITSGVLGDLMSIQAIESVGYWHYAHSFVRGNWRNSDTTTPMIMQKCCHDMDLMVWLSGKKCKRVSSFGHLSHFDKEHAPEGSTMYCVQDCAVKDTCPYNAERFYLDDPTMGVRNGATEWPVNMVCHVPTEENVIEALKTSPYGRCVYQCDNNVVDHQVVNLEMEDGLTVNFTMCAFTGEVSRYTKFMGTKASMIADMDRNIIELTVFGKEKEVITFDELDKHGGGDKVLTEDFLDYMAGMPCDGITELADSVESHLICMAAEESRLRGGEVIDMDLFRKS